MKLHQVLLASLFASSLALLVSCDGDGDSAIDDIGSNQQDRAKVLNQLLEGDTFNFSASSGVDTPSNSWANAQGEATLGTSGILGESGFFLTYRKTGNYTFEYQGVNTVKQSRFFIANNALLGNPSEIGNAFRLTLLQPGTAIPEFNRAQLRRIAEDLNAAGTLAYLHPTKDLVFVLSSIRYTFTSTSTNRDLVRGRMAGSYKATATGSVVTFRRPSSQELSDFNLGIRAITPSHWIPVLSSASASTVVEDYEIGTYTLKLNNITTAVSE